MLIVNVFNSLSQKKNGYTQGRRRNYHKLSPAQREAMIRRTVYVSDIDQQVRVIYINYNFSLFPFVLGFHFDRNLIFGYLFMFVLHIRSPKRTLLLFFLVVDR